MNMGKYIMNSFFVEDEHGRKHSWLPPRSLAGERDQAVL
jgi:hypothetical protein